MIIPLMRQSDKDRKVMREFSKRFDALTKERDPGMSNVALGKVLGVSSTAIYNWKRGQAMPTIANACVAALRYRVSVDWLLTGRNEPIKPSEGHEELREILSGLSESNLARVLEAARAFQALERERG